MRSNASLKVLLPREIVTDLAGEATALNVATPRAYASMVLAGLRPVERRRAYLRAMRFAVEELEPQAMIDPVPVDETAPAASD